MICHEFGGDIICNSEWQKGCNFTFLMTLFKQEKEQENNIHRNKNPTEKLYTKIKL